MSNPADPKKSADESSRAPATAQRRIMRRTFDGGQQRLPRPSLAQRFAQRKPTVEEQAGSPTVSRMAQSFSQVPSHTRLQAKLSVNAPDDQFEAEADAVAKQVVQAKLSVNDPNDKFEAEADAVARAVMRMPMPDASALDGVAHAPDQTGHAQRLPTISSIQASGDAGGDVSPHVEQNISRMQGGGSPLPKSERSFFESRMGVDLSSVRLHTDSNAVQTSQDISARAFTFGGNNIAFNQNEYKPGTSSGRELIAHELTHVVQQGGASTLQAKRLPRADDSA